MNRLHLLPYFRALAGCIMGTALVHAADEPLVVPLWDGGAPGFEARKDEPEVINTRTEPESGAFPITTNIHQPSLLAFLPAPDKATGAAVIIAPGGGHMFLTMDREGVDVARDLRDQGIAAFVLKYRLARAKDSPYSLEHAAQDGRRAVRLVRQRAAEWRVDPARIGLLGFSAGGRPVFGAALDSAVADPGTPDAVSAQSARPDFVGLVYTEVPREYAVSAGFPPTFIVCTWDDNPKVAPLTQLFLKLKEAGVAAEIHVYQRGGHGYGNAERGNPVSRWPERFHEWMVDAGFLK